MQTFQSLQGYFTATRREIEEVFGSPTTTCSDTWEKVTVEWEIQFEDGTRASIYDYKRYEEGTPALDEEYEWHIGGTSFRSAELVSEAMSKGIYEFEMTGPTFRKKIYG